MGTWDYGPFDNDPALDWVDELIDQEDYAFLAETFGGIRNPPEEYLDATDCCAAVAAAETVAALNQQPIRSLPQDVIEWIEGKPAPSPELIDHAKQAIERILASSELKALWEETGEGYREWEATIMDLRSRLIASK